ncbi:beta strand repeat-containing protein [Cyanobium sp. ATX-6F1]|uniref:beta strand repeat-containing protein n=1 Tax=Cyanobium sp. ATX-6F1 TaxID=3137388 RepID=UPI0039BDD6B5
MGTGTVTNNGTIKPGGTGAAGTLNITGNFVSSASGIIEAELGGTTAGSQYDRLAVSGNVTLGGTLNSPLINGFVPSGQSFDVITAGGTATGSFASSNLPSGFNGAIVGSVYRLTNSGLGCLGICWDGGGGDTSWENVANWGGDLLPTAIDVAYLNLVGGVDVTLSSSQSVKGLNSIAGNNLTINSGGSLTLNDSGTSSSLNGGLTINGGTLGGTGDVTVSGAFDVTSSSYLSGPGLFTTQGTSTVNMPSELGGYLNLEGGKNWVNEGTLTIGGDDLIYFGFVGGGANTLTNAVGATLNLSSAAGTPLSYWAGTAEVINAGTLNQTVVGAHTIDVNFNNTGTVNVDVGTLSIGGSGSDSGSYAVDAGTTLNFSSGTRDLNAGSNITGLGTLSVSGATVNANNLLDIASTGTPLTVASGALNLNGSAITGTLAPVSISGGALNVNTTNPITLPSLVLSGGTLGGTGDVTVSGAFDVTSSSYLSGPGLFTTQGTSTVNMPSELGGYLNLEGGKNWVNEGTLTIGGDDLIYFGFVGGGANTLTNAVGATLNLSSAAGTPLSYWAGTAEVINAGTLNQTVVGAHTIDVNFNNTGTVNVDVGTLSIGGSGSDSGSYAVDAGTTLNFSSGTRDLNAGSNITGLGTLSVSGATVNANIALDFLASGTSLSVSNNGSLYVNSGLTVGNLPLDGGTLGGTGDVTVSGAFDVTSFSYLSGPGLFTTQGTSTVNMPSELGGYLNLEGGKNWVNEGTLTIGGDDLIYFGFVGGGANTLTNAVGATLNLSSAAGTPLSYWAGTAEVINAGTLNQTVVGAHTIDVNFNNTGTVNVDVGTLSIGGSGSDSGSYAVDAGTTLNFSSGTRDLNAGSNITGLGTLSVSGATVNANNLLDIASTGTPLTVASGALNLNGSAITGTLAPVSISGGALNVNTTNPITLPSLVLSGGTLGGTGDVTVSGAFDVTSSSYLSGPGLFTTQGTSTVNMPSELGGYLNLEGGKNWVNEGTLTIGGDDLIYFGFVGGGANTLTNAVGATLNLSSAAGTPLSYWAGTAEVINAGTLNQTVVGAHTIDVNFNNTGTVNVDVGTLSIGGSGSDSGSYAVDAGTTLNFSSGTRDLNAGSNITGLGTLSVSGATVNANIALDFLASGTSLSVSNNGSLYVNSGLTVGNLPLDGGTLGGTGDVTVSGAFDVTSFSYLSGPGLFTTQGTSTVNMPSELGGYLNLEGGKNWVNEGTLTIGGDDLIYFGFVGGGANTLTNAVGATLNLSSAAGTPLSYWAGTAEVINAGTLNQTVVGAHTIDVNFNNTGTVNVDVGTLSIGGSGSDSGSYAVDAGTTLNFSSGTRDLNAGSNITGLGTLSVSGATVNANIALDFLASGTSLSVSNNGSLYVNSGLTVGNLPLDGGTLGGTGDVTVSGAFDVTSFSYLSGPGLFTTQGTSTVNMPSELGGYLNLEGGKNWVNEGTLTIGGDDLIYFGFVGGGANTLTNAVGATLNLSSAAGTPLSYWAGTAEVINAGTLNQTVVGAHTIDVNFNNTGTVNVDVGTLSIGGSGSDSGSYAVDAGTTLNFSSGTRDLNAGSNITGLGTLSVSGATVNANIALDFLASGTSLSVSNNGSLYVNSGLTVGNLPLDGGTLGGTGDVTVSGAFDVTSFSYLSGPGLFTTQGTSTVNMPSELGGYLNLEGGKNWVNEGTLTIGGDDLIYFGFVGGGANTLTNAVGATLNLSSAAGTPLSYWAGTAEVINAGTLNQTVVGAHTIDVNFNNTGTVNVDVGTLSIGGSGSDSGSYAVDAGTTLNFSSGTRDLNAGSNITGLGTLSVSGATVNANSGLTIGSNLQLDGGTLGGTGDVTVSGAFDVTSSSYLSGPGLFTTQGTSTVNMPSVSGGSLNISNGKNWVNEGTLTIGGDDLIYFGFVGGGANTLTNAVGATLNLSSAAGTPLSYWAGTAEVINAGTLNQTVVGAHTIDVNFNNTGTVNVDVGTLSIGGSLTQSGAIDVAAGAVFQKSGGFTNASTGTLSGFGTIDVGAGNTLTNLGTISPGGDGVAGALSITGVLALSSTSVLNLDLGGATPGSQYDRLAVSGNVNLGGTINTQLINGFSPSLGQNFDVITSGGTATGSFAGSNLPSGFNGAIVFGSVYRLTNSGLSCLGVCWDGGGGDTSWETLANWSGDQLPTTSDVAYLNLVGGVDVTLSSSQSVKGLNSIVGNNLTINSGGLLTLNDSGTSSTLNGELAIYDGALTTNGALTLNGNSVWAGGTLAGAGSLTVGSGATLVVGGGSGIVPGTYGLSRLTNQGTVQWLAEGLNYSADGVIDNSGLFDVEIGDVWDAAGSFTFAFNNLTGGELRKSGLGISFLGSVNLTNNGLVDVRSGTLVVSPNSLIQNNGLIQTASDASFQVQSDLTNASTGTLSGGIEVYFGTLINFGTISPGGDGVVGVIGADNLILGSTSVLNLDIGGATGSQYDRLFTANVVGNASLDGTINAQLINGYSPSPGQNFDVILSATTTGSFASSNLPSGFNGAIVGSVYRLTNSGLSCLGVCWDGGGGTTGWETLANWSGDQLPTTTDVAYLNLVGGVDVTLSSSQSVKGLNSLVANNLTINSGGSLTLNDPGTASNLAGDLTVNGTLNIESPLSASSLALNGGALGGSGSLTVSNAFTRTGGTTGTSLTGVTLNQASGDLSPGAWSVNGPVSFTAAAGNLLIDGPVTATTLLGRGATGLTLQPGVVLNATASTGSSLVLEAGTGAFTNLAGAGALAVAPGARWLVYSASPLTDNRGGLSYAFKQYGITYGSATPVVGAGNGFLYGATPTVTASLTGSISKTYDGTVAAPLAAGNYLVTGAIDSDTVQVNNPTLGTYTSAGTGGRGAKDAGSGKDVSAAGVAITGASEGAVAVYGYQLASSTATGTALGTINPLALTGAAIAPSSSIYGSALSPGAVSFSNVFSGDLVGATASVNTGGVSSSGNSIVGAYTQTVSTTLSGSDAANYSFSGFTSTPNYTISPLALTGAAIASGSSIYGSALAPGAVSFGNLLVGDLVGATASVNTGGVSSSGNSIVGAYTQSAGTTLIGGDAANYSFSGFTSTPNYTISPLALTGAAIGSGSSIYGSALTPGAVSFGNLFSGDLVGAAAAVNTSTLSTGGNPIVGAYTQSASTALSGSDAANYSFSGFTSTPNYTISPLALTGAAIASGSSTYGSALTPGAVSFGNLFSGDLVGSAISVNTSILSTGGQAIVGGYTQSASTALSGSDAANYSFSGFTSASIYTISPLDLTATGFSRTTRSTTATPWRRSAPAARPLRV